MKTDRLAPRLKILKGGFVTLTPTDASVRAEGLPAVVMEDGKDLSELPLTSLAGLDGVVIRCDARKITRDVFEGRELAGRAVLIHTGWDRHWRTDAYFEEHPFITEDAALFLKQSGVKLVGIDSYNMDDTQGKARPAHSILLGSEIPIVEHMTGLAQLPEWAFKFFAVPPKVKAFGTFPVRCFAM